MLLLHLFSVAVLRPGSVYSVPSFVLQVNIVDVAVAEDTQHRLADRHRLALPHMYTVMEELVCNSGFSSAAN